MTCDIRTDALLYVPWRGLASSMEAYPLDRSNQLAAAAVNAILYETSRKRTVETLRKIADEIEQKEGAT